jgi:hypothetical protein
MNLPKNIGLIDRILRVAIAGVILALYINHSLSGTVGIVLLVAALALLLTSFIGTCPLYLPFNIFTTKRK